jgi:hypothetical protein
MPISYKAICIANAAFSLSCAILAALSLVFVNVHSSFQVAVLLMLLAILTLCSASWMGIMHRLEQIGNQLSRKD